MTKLPAIRKPPRASVSNEALFMELQELRRDVAKLHATLAATFHEECCPKMAKISKELGDRLIEKLVADDKARKHTVGEL